PATPLARSLATIACIALPRFGVLAHARVTQRVTGGDLVRLEHGDHVDAWSANAHRQEPAPAIRVEIRHLVVHQIAAGLPKRLTRNDFTGLLPLELEEDPAFQYVPENRPGMAMRPRPGVCGRELDELRHRVCPLGNPGWGDAQKIGDLGVSCSQHV